MTSFSRLPAQDRSLSLRGVTKHFGATVAVAPLDLSVRPGALLALLGPSGCGKTTTLRMIAGFEQPDAGHILIGGHDVTGEPPRRRGVGMVFQHYGLFPHMTVAENVAFALSVRRAPRAEIGQRVAEMLALVRLPGFEDRFPAQLSGGQQQRVALARALIANPSVLLLDEPLGALDRSLRESMQFELRRLQSSLGITAVLVTHDQEEALTMSDRIAVMNAGRIVQVGAPEEVYHRPRTRFVAEFLGTANILEARREGRDGDGLDRLRLTGTPYAFLAPAGTDGPRMLALRPERAWLTREAQSGVNTLPAEVAGHVFRGGYHAYELRVEGLEPPLIAHLQGGEAAGWQVGAPVLFCWQPEAATELERE